MLPSIPTIQTLTSMIQPSEQPVFSSQHSAHLLIRARDLPSIDQTPNPDLVTSELPTLDTSLNQLAPATALDSDTLELSTFDIPTEPSPDPSLTEAGPSWIEVTDWLPPHMGPVPTYLMPAPMFGFPVLEPSQTNEAETSSGTLPTELPEDLFAASSPEVLDAGTVIDRMFEWAFLDSGDVTVNGEVLSPVDGRLTRWLAGDTTYAGLFNDGLLIGPHLIPYPEEYKRWMQEHNIVIWG